MVTMLTVTRQWAWLTPSADVNERAAILTMQLMPCSINAACAWTLSNSANPQDSPGSTHAFINFIKNLNKSARH